jgi:hypothetical protein
MSVWSSLEGTLVIHPRESFSIKKYTHAMFDEHSLSIVDRVVSKDNEIFYKIELSVCLDGDEAYRMLSYWLSGIPGRADVEIIVRKLK